MSRNGYARLAGFTFLFYIATGITEMVLSGRVHHGENVAAILANIVQHEQLARLTNLFTLINCVNALVLGLALYALTRDVEPNLAMLALLFRAGEGILAANAALQNARLIEFAKRTAGRANADIVGTSLLYGAGMLVGASLFAFGSTIFSYLFLRSRIIPVWLSWLGLIGSIIIAIALPLQLAGLLHGLITNLIWIPIALFEIILGVWLLVKGVRTREGSLRASSDSLR